MAASAPFCHNRFYVNSWGRAQNKIGIDRVGVKAPTRFLCITEENSFSEIIEATHTVGHSLEYFGFIVTAFHVARHMHGITQKGCTLVIVPQQRSLAGDHAPARLWHILSCFT
jgi:hypothetical protein